MCVIRTSFFGLVCQGCCGYLSSAGMIQFWTTLPKRSLSAVFLSKLLVVDLFQLFKIILNALVIKHRIRCWLAIIVLCLFIPSASFASDYIKINTSHFAFYLHPQDDRLMKPLITSTTTLWFLITVAFIPGYLRKRRANRLKLEEWEREDEYLWGCPRMRNFLRGQGHLSMTQRLRRVTVFSLNLSIYFTTW